MKQIRKGTRVHTGYGKGVVVKKCADMAYEVRYDDGAVGLVHKYDLTILPT